jgi:DNA-directed RNA polymerase subunit alpha
MEITLPKQPKIEESSDNRAVFVIEELYPGYGVTLGNALRRVLYSSIPGAAITQVKIKGVSHEFSTLKGVLEDVLEITMNLKQVSIKLHGDDPQTATIKAKGSRKITAGDIEAPSQVEIANKEAYITTLTSKDSSFEAELIIEPGLGYMPVEQRSNTSTEMGAIPLDAIFTPIRKVNFEVENMRVGDRTDFNKLSLEVVTNGTITPSYALNYVSKILAGHFERAGQVDVPEEKKITKVKNKSVKKSSKKTNTIKKSKKK